MSKKISLYISLFATGLLGILVGSFIVSKQKPEVDYSTAIAKSSEVKSENYNLYDLNKSFINISKEVTPAIVSIYSTKIIKQNRYREFFDDPFFRRFFGPDIPFPDDENHQEQQGLGSGVIVKSDGTVLTNNHVVDGADEISIVLSDKRRFKAKIIGTDPKSDIAVIKIENPKDLPLAKLGDSSSLEVGEWVLAIGNPLGLSSTVTAGIISAKDRSNVGVADFEDFIQTDAAINPGNSGGALVNLKGEVIGINTAIASKTGGYMGIGFAIPINMAKKVMNDILTKGKVTRGFLGIQIQNLNDNLSKALKIPQNTTGIVVGDVYKNSPADKAGIKSNDVIIKLDGQSVEDVNSFRNEIANKNPGETVKLDIIRNSKNISINVKLGELNQRSFETEEENMELQTEKLGFTVEPLTDVLKNRLGINRRINGLVVSKVEEGSSAEEAGLLVGDVILEINRNKIDNISDFNKIVKEIKSGDSILLKIHRNGSNLLIAFTK
ncbi:MAG: serine protease [Candidatus Sericytochromatia bacterium]|nr:MAG: serine protease [Candidatus Sericytochromatia bacterium]